LVAVPALFMNLSEVTDLAVIGTLFAFALVCAGVLVKDKEFGRENRFVPYINSLYVMPVLFLIIAGLAYYYTGDAVLNFLTDFTPPPGESALWGFLHKLPYLAFAFFAVFMVIFSSIERWTVIPVLGILFCGYLMSELGITNWIRFGVWLIIGLALYFTYGHKHSNLNKIKPEEAVAE
jgi:hypothetical protein